MTGEAMRSRVGREIFQQFHAPGLHFSICSSLLCVFISALLFLYSIVNVGGLSDRERKRKKGIADDDNGFLTHVKANKRLLGWKLMENYIVALIRYWTIFLDDFSFTSH